MLIAGLLFVNVCFMAAQLQYLGLRIGHSIGYPRYDQPAHQAGARWGGGGGCVLA